MRLLKLIIGSSKQGLSELHTFHTRIIKFNKQHQSLDSRLTLTSRTQSWVVKTSCRSWWAPGGQHHDVLRGGQHRVVLSGEHTEALCSLMGSISTQRAD